MFVSSDHRPHQMLPMFLTGMAMFVGGITQQQQWLAFLGIAIFLAAHTLPLDASLRDLLPRRRQVMPRDTARPRAEAAKPGRAGAAPNASPRQIAEDAAGAADAEPAAISQALRDAVDAHAQSREAADAGPVVTLRPVVPLRPGSDVHSWFGGMPIMPLDLDWPMIGGKPGLFTAQLSCARFPETLWLGKGPRQGWLLFFVGQGAFDQCVVLHAKRFGEERQPPAALRYPLLPAARTDMLALATGRAAAIPRWPVEFSLDAGHAGLDDDDNLFVADPAELPVPGHDDPAFLPFDWPSAMILAKTAANTLAWQIEVMRAMLPQGGSPESRAELAEATAYISEFEAAAAQSAALATELRAAQEAGLPFDDKLRQLLLSALSRLRVSAPEPALFREGPARAVSLLDHDLIRTDYFRWLDHHARLTYAEEPGALPRDQRALFEEIWSLRALRECGRIGGHAPAAPRQPRPPAPATDSAVTLLELPSSELLGWSFGKTGALSFRIGREALEAGDFSQCRSRVLSS